MLLKSLCVTTFILILIDEEVKCSTIYSESARHGGEGGSLFKVVCPYNGALTGINYRSGSKVDQLSFVCTSSMGRTTLGPFGGDGGGAGSVSCPQGHYISSVYGKSGSRLDQLGIRCRRENDMTSNGKPEKEFGGSGGGSFDDLALSIGARPISILIRAGSEVDSIQIGYGNIPLASLCIDCSKYQEEWAPKHGGGGGGLQSFVCPEQGVLTGITIRSGSYVDSIQFTCSSSLGESSFGPYGSGGGGGEKFIDKCPPGSYVGSIHGKSGSKVDKFGIRCVKIGQAGSSPKRDAHGGNGGGDFDDDNFATRGRRPVEIRIWSGSLIDAIQIKYGNAPVALNCKVARIEVIDQSIVAQPDGIEVIGITSGSTCSSIEQKLILQTANSVSETVGVDTTEGGEFNWQTTVSISFTTGVNLGAKSEISVGLSQSLGGSKSWSHTNTRSTTTDTQRTQGAEIGYKGPGACIVIGFANRFKISKENVPVLFHFQCDGGEVTPEPSHIKLTSTTFGKADFQDYHFTFKNQESCTPEARSCVAALRANNLISDPKNLQSSFNKCFPVDSGTPY